MGYIFYLMGKSASGKDSLFRLLTLTREAAAAQKRNANAALLVTSLCARLRAAAGR